MRDQFDATLSKTPQISTRSSDVYSRSPNVLQDDESNLMAAILWLTAPFIP